MTASNSLVKCKPASATFACHGLLSSSPDSPSLPVPSHTSPSPSALPPLADTHAAVSALFARVPAHLTWDAIELEFLSHPSTLLLVSLSASGHTHAAMSTEMLNSTAGRAAWRRFRRAEFYLSHAARELSVNALLVADMRDMAEPSPDSSVPRFAASAAPCTLSLPVPIPLKGFGSTDLELLLAGSSSTPRQLLARAPEWSKRRDAAVWRGAARVYPPHRTCLPTGQRYDEHPRGQLVALGASAPHVGLDAGFTSAGPRRPNGRPVDPGLERHRKPALSFEALGGYRYQVEVDGSGYMASLAAKLLSGSTVLAPRLTLTLVPNPNPNPDPNQVLAPRSHFPLWLSPMLRNGEHLVETRPDLSDFPAALAALRNDTARARAIAAAGAARAAQLLRQSSIQAYVTSLLRVYVGRFDAAERTMARGGGGGGGGGEARLATLCARAAEEARAAHAERAGMAPTAGAEDGGYTPHHDSYCRGAAKSSETQQPTPAACRASCARAHGDARAPCFQFSRVARTCRCATAESYFGLGASKNGYVAWVRSTTPLVAPLVRASVGTRGAAPSGAGGARAGRRLLSARIQSAAREQAREQARSRPSGSQGSGAQRLRRRREFPLRPLTCAAHEPAPARPPRLSDELTSSMGRRARPG